MLLADWLQLVGWERAAAEMLLRFGRTKLLTGLDEAAP